MLISRLTRRATSPCRRLARLYLGAHRIAANVVSRLVRAGWSAKMTQSEAPAGKAAESAPRSSRVTITADGSVEA